MSNICSAGDAMSSDGQRIDKEALTRLGFNVHRGGRFDGALCGRWWWTLCQPGWSGVETAHFDFDTADQAWLDAAKHLESDLELAQPKIGLAAQRHNAQEKYDGTDRIRCAEIACEPRTIPPASPSCNHPTGNYRGGILG
ncbi:hypothetical protein [Burkholderia ubonensis]|nr:hypothetical protein [Burkholderia ubonensis]